MEVLKTTGKVIDSAVLVGGVIVGIGAVMNMVSGFKGKKYGAVAIGGLTLLIGIYAIKEASSKLNA